MRRDPRIESEEATEGTHWLYLKPGWVTDGDEHAIAEDSRAKAVNKLPELRRCKCSECVAMIAGIISRVA